MDKKRARIRIGDLLDVCEECEKRPKASNLPVSFIEKACGGCAVYQEIKEIRPILTGEKQKPKRRGGKRIDMTVEEYVQLHYINGQSNAEIAHLKGCATQTIYNFRKKHKEEIEKTKKEKGLAEQPEKKSVIAPAPMKKVETESIDWKTKYEEANELIEEQKIEITARQVNISSMCRKMNSKLYGMNILQTSDILKALIWKVER